MERIALLVCLCMAARPAAGQWLRNFADNPSAEADRNRDGVPDGWKGSAFRSPAKLAWDKAVAHWGGASLRISDSASPAGKEWDRHTGRWIATAKRKVTPGRTYTLGAWIRTKGVTGTASARIAWWKGGQWLAESTTKRIRGTGDWQWVTVQAAAPPRADAAQIYLGLSQSRGTAWFDDIMMAAGSSLPRTFQTVDLAAACNTGFRDETAGDGKGGWTDQGTNDMRNLPTGKVRLRGVPFEILSPERNDGKTCVVLKGKGREGFPSRVTIPLGRKCETIYFLHCCAWGRKAARVGRYELVYSDGSTVTLPLTCGRQITDWWQCSDTKLAAAAWEGGNAESDAVGLNLFPVANTRPDRPIREIRFHSAGGDPVPILVAVTTADGPPVLADRPIRYEFTDTSGWYPFNFPLTDTNLDRIDLTRFLDPPAGKHGFLTVKPDGHFYFRDGTRARFFGTNVGGPRAFPEKPEARVLAARLAKYGVNLLRIHAIDGRWGPLIDYAKGDSRHFSARALDRLDFFFAELKKRGIYVYFDMLDYRRFLDADGVKDASKFQHGWRHSIKGATIFNDRLIELQKEFATKFFTHRNPYTKLRYVDDPAVAVVEITNENSVFYFSNTALTLPVYVDELRTRWNRWLLAQYGARAKLATAWTNAKGECALLADEDPARGSVFLPIKHLYQDPAKADYVGHRSPARVNAMVRFFFDTERRYYNEIRAHLKKIGIRVPITGTNQTFCPPSTYADAVNDFMSRNNYWCHPNVRAKPFVTFRNLAVVNSDIPRTMNPVTEIASSTVVGKPMISPEFNFPWPIEFRAECLPLMAAYACLQDWDGLLFFTYSPERKYLEHFGNQSDPVRWGQFPAAALIFHRRDVATARNTVHVGYSRTDIFSARPSHRRDRFSPFRYLPYISKVRNAYFDSAYEGDADVVVASGYSPNASYAKARRAIVFAKSPWTDWAHRKRNRAAGAASVTPEAVFRAGEGRIPLRFRRLLWPDRTLTLSPDTLVAAASLPKGAAPIGTTRDGKSCLGFLTDRFCVIPHAGALAEVDTVWDYRIFAEAAREWGLLEYGNFADIEKRYVSDTGELSLDRGRGVFTIDTARTKAAVGFLQKAGTIRLSGVTIECETPFAAVMVTSLDGRPVGESKHVLVTAVARAENTGQAFYRNKTAIPERGRPPVLAEPVQCRLLLPVAAKAGVYPLDETGRRRAKLAATVEAKRLSFRTGAARSPWCEIVVE